jgi:hypothetical protein
MISGYFAPAYGLNGRRDVKNGRVLVVMVVTAIAVSMLAAAGVAWGQETETSPTLNPTPDDIWMTNGIVYSVIRSGDYIYVGGNFTRARSAATGGKSFLATDVARFDADTGVGDPSWTPDVTGADPTTTIVYALAAAGGKIWVGGKFEAVDGVARRNLAAVSEQTGEVDPSVDPLVGSETAQGVKALLASDTMVYVGGGFSTIDGNGRRNLGALDLFGNLDPMWKPQADSRVQSLAFSCDKATVFAGGKFRNAAGSDGVYAPRETLARFDPTSGGLHPWAVPAGSVPNDEVAADLAVTCERITGGYLGRNYVRSFRLDTGDTGTKVWENKCAGNVQTVTMLGDEKLIIGGHFSQIDDAAPTNGVRRIRIAMLNLSDGIVDPTWAPEVDGSFYGPWDLLVDESHLYVGGAFKTVAGEEVTHFARFSFAAPPTISSVSPADGATEVAPQANAVATFSEAMDEGSVETSGNFTLTGPGGLVPAAAVDYDPSTNKATLDPAADLESGLTYTATIKGGTDGVKDSAGNPLASDEVWSFTTLRACTISGTSNAETITGTSADDVICAGGGSDTIKALEGNDTIKAEGGADRLYGGMGDDRLDGGTGTDNANFSESLTAVSASLETNTATGEGSDTFSSIENLTGSNGNDTLRGSEANNNLNGLGGVDGIVGLGGADTLLGAASNDTLDSQDGVEGNDSVDGGGGTDICTTDATENSIVNCEPQ